MNLLLISSSKVYRYGFLDHAEAEIRSFLGTAKRVAFIPFAFHDHERYTARVADRFAAMKYEVVAVRNASDLDKRDAIFVGGGNTFRLLKTLYDRDMLDAIRQRVRGGVPYIGSSAGSLIASPTMRTTNDMPIVEPKSLAALGLVPYQLNCHYIDADPSSTHMGETREVRLAEYLEENETPVLGIREGTMVRVDGAVTTVAGSKPAKVFRRGEMPFDVAVGTKLDGKLVEIRER